MYCVYSVSTDNILVWMCEVQYTVYITDYMLYILLIICVIPAALLSASWCVSQSIFFLAVNTINSQTNQFNITVMKLVLFSCCYMFRSMFRLS
jgi:sensor domain CHASE-containing protein